MAKATFNKKNFTSKLNLNFRKKILKFFVMIVDYYGAEILTLRKS